VARTNEFKNRTKPGSCFAASAAPPPVSEGEPVLARVRVYVVVEVEAEAESWAEQQVDSWAVRQLGS
jgi:hypothetical protein